jgi:hypothetical protein
MPHCEKIPLVSENGLVEVLKIWARDPLLFFCIRTAPDSRNLADFLGSRAELSTGLAGDPYFCPCCLRVLSPFAPAACDTETQNDVQRIPASLSSGPVHYTVLHQAPRVGPCILAQTMLDLNKVCHMVKSKYRTKILQPISYFHDININ